MKRNLQIVLNVAQKGLEQQTQEKDPRMGADGYLHFLLEAVAECRLSRTQQEQVNAILALHRRCSYPLLFLAGREQGAI